MSKITIDPDKSYTTTEALDYLRICNGVSKSRFYDGGMVDRMAFYWVSPGKRFILGKDLLFFSELLKKNVNPAQKYQRTA